MNDEANKEKTALEKLTDTLMEGLAANKEFAGKSGSEVARELERKRLEKRLHRKRRPILQ